MHTFYVYKWTHTESGRAYIGKGRGRRARSHLHRARRGHTGCPLFYNALRKYGAQSFVLEFLALGLPESLAFVLESAAIDAYGSREPRGFNLTGGGDGISGYRHTAETRAKISTNAERNAKISAAHKGKKLTDEHKEKLRAAKKGRTQTPEHVARVKESKRKAFAARGAKASPERVKELHAQGLGDGDIAKALGCHSSNIYLTRKKLGLVANKRQGWQHGP